MTTHADTSTQHAHRLSLIVAAADNGVIGRDGQLPWHLPNDLRRFKAITLGHAIIMGRITYESIGEPLPGRRNIVLSRDPDYRAQGAEVARSLDDALTAATDGEQLFVIGGATLFAEALPIADRIYLTRVHAAVAGDVSFPRLDEQRWRLVSEEHHPADPEHRFAFSFRVYEPIDQRGSVAGLATGLRRP